MIIFLAIMIYDPYAVLFLLIISNGIICHRTPISVNSYLAL